jgi:hypothetical protein
LSTTDQYLHDRYTTETLRLPPVLMGVASAAIGFAFHETSDRDLAWPLSLALAAVLLWSASFACGVLFSRNYAHATKSNLGLNVAKREGYAHGAALAQAALDKSNTRSSRYYASQQWTLLLGALAYLAGHIWYLSDRPTTQVDLGPPPCDVQSRSSPTEKVMAPPQKEKLPPASN